MTGLSTEQREAAVRRAGRMLVKLQEQEHHTAVAARYVMFYEPGITTPLVVRLALVWNRGPRALRVLEAKP